MWAPGHYGPVLMLKDAFQNMQKVLKVRFRERSWFRLKLWVEVKGYFILFYLYFMLSFYFIDF